MHLTEDDKELFYRLWFGLIQFTNTKFNIDPTIGPPGSSGGVDANKVVPVRDRLWCEDSLIDEYLCVNGASIPEDEQKILLGWKKRVPGDFILLKHLARYSVFMDFRDEDPNLYGVVGLTSELSEMFPQAVMPVLVNATLLPFKGMIIYDSLLSAKNIRFGGGYKKNFNESYKRSKEKLGIKTSFDILPLPSVQVPKLHKKTSGKKRRQRIYDDILVDTYGEEDAEIMSWYYYLEGRMSFPFHALCIKEMPQSPLSLNEKLTVTGLPSLEICDRRMFINIKFKRRSLAIPLEQIEAIDAPANLYEAIEDWKYWIGGCIDD